MLLWHQKVGKTDYLAGIMTHKPYIAIIGAGLAGLSCAYYLEKAGWKAILYEMDGRVGGRIQTDRLEGFLLDRGFQIVLSSYPEFKRLFKPQALQLKSIPSGAMIYYDKHWHLLENPLQNPSFLYYSKDLPFIQQGDLFKVVKLYGSAWLSSFDSSQPPQSTGDFLKQTGLSSSFIEAFWRPFFGGVFLDLDLQTQISTFAHLAAFFATGLACLPAEGMQAIPLQLAQRLKKSHLLTHHRVQAIEGQQLVLSTGEVQAADKIVLATDAWQAAQMDSHLSAPPARSVTCLYFALDQDALSFSPYLYLNGMRQGPINNLLFNSITQPTYAPSGQVLASVTVIEPSWQNHDNLLEAVLDQLETWFNVSAKKWRHLRTYRILHALPAQVEAPFNPYAFLEHQPHVYLCGELVDEPSINGALYSGRIVAEKLMAEH